VGEASTPALLILQTRKKGGYQNPPATTGFDGCYSTRIRQQLIPSGAHFFRCESAFFTCADTHVVAAWMGGAVDFNDGLPLQWCGGRCREDIMRPFFKPEQ